MTGAIRTIGNRLASVAVGMIILAAAGCATARPALESRSGQVGVASYYAREHHGRRTASGERYDMSAMTAAHRTLRFGTRARVTNLRNGRSVTVRINDRGPFRKGRIVDLSYAAARKLGVTSAGLARVRLEVL